MSKNMTNPTVDIQRASDFEPQPSDAQLTQWATVGLQSREHAEVTIRLVDELEITQLNSIYRKKDKPTNVLSFPVDLPPDVEDDLLGDIVICASVIDQEAKQQHKTYEQHFAHMVIHGCLHLLGYDHVTEEQANVMEPLEIKLLAELNYPNPYEVTR